MVDYDFEYQYKEYKHKQREYRIPIKNHIGNKHLQQQQIEFIRNLYPNGLNKEIKLNDDDQLEFIEDLVPNGINKIVEVN